MFEGGREVDNPPISLLFAGLFSHNVNTSCVRTMAPDSTRHEGPNTVTRATTLHS